MFTETFAWTDTLNWSVTIHMHTMQLLTHIIMLLYSWVCFSSAIQMLYFSPYFERVPIKPQYWERKTKVFDWYTCKYITFYYIILLFLLALLLCLQNSLPTYVSVSCATYLPWLPAKSCMTCILINNYPSFQDLNWTNPGINSC